MADLSSILGNIPGYGGFLAQQQLGQQKRAEDLATNVNQMKLADLMMQTKRQQDLQKILAATGGDPAKAIPLLMQGGYAKEAEGLSTLAKQQQEQTGQTQLADIGSNIETLQRPDLQNIPGGVGYAGIREPELKANITRATMIDGDKGKALQAQVFPEVKKEDKGTSDMQESTSLADIEVGADKRGTPEWNKVYTKYLIEARKGKGTNVTTIVGGEKPIDIPKFRAQVQDTIKPYMATTDAADTSLEMLDLAIKQSNPTAFQGSRVQLAKAFGDSNITGAEIKDAGGDPSIWGGLKDSTSTLFTGTPSMETMYSMKKTLNALKKVAETKGKKEIESQKKMARRAGIQEEDITNIFDFSQFTAPSQPTGNANGQPRTAEDLLRSRGLMK